MTAQTSFERYRFGHGTKEQFDTPHKHFWDILSEDQLKKEPSKPTHVAVTLCFHTVDATKERPEPDMDIVDQVVKGFENKMKKARLVPIKPGTLLTCAATELSPDRDLVTTQGVSRTYVTFRLPLAACDKVRRLVSAPAQESSLDFRPHTRHQQPLYAPEL